MTSRRFSQRQVLPPPRVPGYQLKFDPRYSKADEIALLNREVDAAQRAYDFDTLLEIALSRIAAFRDPSSHLLASFVYDERGEDERADFHRREALRLVPALGTRAIGPGGDSDAHALIRTWMAWSALRRGEYAPKVWRNFDYSRFSHALQGNLPVKIPEWSRPPRKGARVLIWPTEGFGDQIMFARLAPMLQAQGYRVTLGTRPELMRAFGGLGVDLYEAKPGPGYADTPPADCWVHMYTLPSILGVTLENLPAAPYIRAGTPRVIRGAHVGFKTNGSPTFEGEWNRGLPDSQAKRLRAWQFGVCLDPAVTGARDFADTAAVIAGLDLVITTDTSVAHLAGAMGKRVWIMLPAFNPDWRWMRDRPDSPWYPSAKLYRQPRPGDWKSVIDRVEADMADLFGVSATTTKSVVPEPAAEPPVPALVPKQGNGWIRRWLSKPGLHMGGAA